MKIYDLVIIGSGPAGMSAAIYAQRAMLDFVMIEKEYMPGGQVVQTYEVDNYPGIPKTNGMDLGLKFSEHAKELGAKSITAEVKEIYADEEIKEIMLKNGDTLKTRTIILATGAVHQTLGIEGEEKLKGMGVSYCATCDGAFFRNKVTAVVGGGNVALEDAIFLSRMCKKVYLIHRRDEFRGAKILQDEVKKNDKIEILWNTIVTKIDGDEVVDKTSFRAFIWKVINRRKRIYYRGRRRCYKYSGNLCCRGWKKQKSSSGGDGGVRWCQLCVFSRAISSKCLIFRQFKLFLYSDS